MPPKKVLRLEKGQKTLSFAAGEDGIKEGENDRVPAVSVVASSSSNTVMDTTTKEAAASSSRTFRVAWLKEFQPWLQ